MHDARFVVASSDDIQITGADHLTRDQILSVFGADLERNIFRVSLGERQADLERLPWVAHATVMRLLPNVLRVQITERTPVAFVRQGSQIGLVDASGVLLDMPADAAGDPHYSFPVLTGLSADEAASERSAKMEVYEQFMHELDGSGQRLTDSVSEVDVADPEDVKALITVGKLGHPGALWARKSFCSGTSSSSSICRSGSSSIRSWRRRTCGMTGRLCWRCRAMGSRLRLVRWRQASVASPAPVIAKPVEAKPVASVKPAVTKAPAATVVAAKPPVAKPAAVNVAAAKAGAPKTVAPKPAAPKPSAPTTDAVNVAAAKSPVRSLTSRMRICRRLRRRSRW